MILLVFSLELFVIVFKGFGKFYTQIQQAQNTFRNEQFYFIMSHKEKRNIPYVFVALSLWLENTKWSMSEKTVKITTITLFLEYTLIYITIFKN